MIDDALRNWRRMEERRCGDGSGLKQGFSPAMVREMVDAVNAGEFCRRAVERVDYLVEAVGRIDRTLVGICGQAYLRYPDGQAPLRYLYVC